MITDRNWLMKSSILFRETVKEGRSNLKDINASNGTKKDFCTTLAGYLTELDVRAENEGFV